MKKFKYLLIVFALVLVVGCGSKTSSKEASKEVTDEAIITTLTNNVVVLQKLPKTMEIYKKGKGSISDYDNSDYVLMGLNANLQYIYRENNQIILNTDIEAEANKIVGPVNIKYDVQSYNGCPVFVYNAAKAGYALNTNCKEADVDSIISRVDSITVDGTEYKVVVYAGLRSGNAIYKDMDKSEKVADMSGEEAYSITEEDKDKFNKYEYIFKKNTDGNYVIDTITKK